MTTFGESGPSGRAYGVFDPFDHRLGYLGPCPSLPLCVDVGALNSRLAELKVTRNALMEHNAMYAKRIARLEWEVAKIHKQRQGRALSSAQDVLQLQRAKRGLVAANAVITEILRELEVAYGQALSDLKEVRKQVSQQQAASKVAAATSAREKAAWVAQEQELKETLRQEQAETQQAVEQVHERELQRQQLESDLAAAHHASKAQLELDQVEQQKLRDQLASSEAQLQAVLKWAQDQQHELKEQFARKADELQAQLKGAQDEQQRLKQGHASKEGRLQEQVNQLQGTLASKEAELVQQVQQLEGRVEELEDQKQHLSAVNGSRRKGHKLLQLADLSCKGLGCVVAAGAVLVTGRKCMGRGVGSA